VSVEGALNHVLRGWAREAGLRRWRARAHRGDAVRCPLCGRGFDGWAPGRRCWWCDGGPRERAVWAVLDERPELLAYDSELLHFEPGWGLQARVASRSGFEYVTAGADPEVVNIVLHPAAIDLPDGSYDGIIAPHDADAGPDGPRALAELRRVLRPGGWLLLVAGDEAEAALRAAGLAPERAGEGVWLSRRIG
jgi:SAM-dependent methyltransferase